MHISNFKYTTLIVIIIYFSNLSASELTYELDGDDVKYYINNVEVKIKDNQINIARDILYKNKSFKALERFNEVIYERSVYNYIAGVGGFGVGSSLGGVAASKGFNDVLFIISSVVMVVGLALNTNFDKKMKNVIDMHSLNMKNYKVDDVEQKPQKIWPGSSSVNITIANYQF